MITQPRLSAILVVIVLALPIFGGLAAAADTKSTTSDPTDAQIRNLQREIRTLQQQLDKLGNAQGAPSQQRLMQQNWKSMLDYMHGMQSMPWMMGEPEEAGRGMMGRGMRGPRNRHDWMMGCPMVGGPSGGWQLPPEVDAGQYRSQMLQNAQRMQDQMAKIWSTNDPAERRRLLQEHWQDTYRNMQSMRGMGWMWGGPMSGGQAATRLPEPASQGAKLVRQYCTQCHAEPSPKLHTAAEWQAVTARMKMNMKNLNAGNWRGVKVPSDAEMNSILEYMRKFAR